VTSPLDRSEYTLVRRIPTVAEYNRTRQAAGLRLRDETAAERGLANSLFAVCVEHKDTVVGIGRVIGDGGLFYDIVDIAVDPNHQGKGLGRMIMAGLLEWIDANAPPTSLVCLMANKGIASFYEKFGFVARDADMPGMIIRK
jgi:GNAT superfamily N-acetyltransferase